LARIEDRQAWLEDVFRRHNERVFRTCLRFAAGDRDWALDRTGEVFMKLTERSDAVQQRDDPGGWLYKVAVTTCYMELRRERTWGRLRGVFAAAQDDTAPGPAGRVHARAALEAIEPVLRALPAKQRAVTVLVDVEGKSQNDAAALLGLSKGQVSKLHAKTRRQLRERGWTVNDA